MAVQLRQSGLTWHQVGDEVVVLDLDGSAYFKANGSGTLLWQLLSRPRSREELVAALVDEFGIDAETAGGDVDEFLGDLTRRGLVESAQA